MPHTAKKMQPSPLVPSVLYWGSSICILILLLNYFTLGGGVLANISLLLVIPFYLIYRQFSRLLKTQKLQIDLILKTSPVAIALAEKTHAVLPQANKRFYQFLETDKNGESISLLLNRLTHEETTSSNNVSKNQSTYEKTIEKADGSTISLKIKHQQKPLKHSNNVVEFYSLEESFSDHENSDDVSLNESQMRFIIETSPVGFHWYSKREESDQKPSNSKYYNSSHKRITGLSEIEMSTPGAFSDITHPDDLKKQIEVRERLNKREVDQVSLEKRYLRKDGRVVWVDSSWTRKWNRDGDGFQEVNTLTNITELKEASRRLKQKESQLRFIFESAPIGLRLCYSEQPNPESPIKHLERLANPAHLKITGLSATETDTPGIFKKITHPDDLLIQIKGESTNLDQKSGFFTMEKRYIRNDGKVIWVAITWLRQWDRSGKRFQELSTLIDITEKKKMSEEIVKAKTLAEEANKAKSQFLATMSHEIRTPMNGLIGVLHIMDGTRPEENEKYIRIAQKSANDLLTLINDILDFSKFEAGKIEFQDLEFAIDELIEDAAEIHVNAAANKGLNIITNISPDAAVKIQSDPHRLRQIISNFVNNAIKFTQTGTIEIGVRKTNTKSQIELYVRDTGIGIDPEIQKKLFQAFTQANASTTRQYGGTGLGLSICKSIITYMDGEIGVDSEPDEGSTFWIRLPPQTSKPISELIAPAHERQTKSALIIHSCPSTLQYIQTWLDTWGLKTEIIRITKDLTDKQHLLESKYDYVLIEPDTFNSLQKQAPMIVAFLNESYLISLNAPQDQSSIPNASIQLDTPIRVRELREAIGGSMIDTNEIQSSEDSKQDWSNDLSACSVLLVDDNPINQMVTAKLLLQKHNISADIATNGIEAISSIENKKYDIVLMDCMMPEMDGYEATRGVRDGNCGEHNKNIPIIALTANALEGDRDKCIEAGMDDYLTKPIHPSSLKRVLIRWIPTTQER